MSASVSPVVSEQLLPDCILIIRCWENSDIPLPRDQQLRGEEPSTELVDDDSPLVVGPRCLVNGVVLGVIVWAAIAAIWMML